MRFDRESWRKLYVAESVEHKRLPVVARGIRDYLIRFAKEDGTLIAKTNDPARDLALALGSHPDEFNLVSDAVRQWIELGYLKYRRERLWISKFVDAQASRSPGAVRQARYRNKSKNGQVQDASSHDQGVTGSVTGDVTENVTQPSPPASRVTSQKTRQDNTRSTAAARVRDDQRIRCPHDLHLLPEQIATLETGQVPRWVVPICTTKFVAKYVARADELRTLNAWRNSLITAIHGDWNDPRKRPKKPEFREEDEPTGSNAEEFERRRMEAYGT